MDFALHSAPPIPKPKIAPNFDSTYLIRDLFQDEFGSSIPSKQLSANILTSLQYEKPAAGEEKETFRSVNNNAGKWSEKKETILRFAENVFEAYTKHEKTLENIRNAERVICKNHLHYLKREEIILEDKAIQDLLALKRQPLFRSLDRKLVRKFGLLQGDAGLPPLFEARLDFRVQNYSTWKKRLESISQDSLIMTYMNRIPENLPVLHIGKKTCGGTKDYLTMKQYKMRKPRLKKTKASSEEKEEEILRAEPKTVFFTDYKPGETYVAEVMVKNVSTNGVQFHLKPTLSSSPFKVLFNSEKNSTKLYPGLSFHLRIQFSPKTLDMAAEDVHIALENGKKFLIPLMAYLEPPVLKTHKDIDEFTRVTSEKIASSCIECGSCFTGDTKVTKLRFQCFRGSAEFFIMSAENWDRSHVKSVTVDNLLELPPFRIYPVFFKMEKNEVIDLFVEFLPKNSGMHVESIMIACDNGEVRSLDLLGDAISWHSYFFSFQDCLLKQLPVDSDDDPKIKYYLDFEGALPTGKIEKIFYIANNSNMPFEFQWKIREANISSNPEKYFKIQKNQVHIDPENGTLEPNSILEFLVTINFENAAIGHYRSALSLYVLNLPYQCIEEDDTVIQPTGFVRNLYSQSLYGEKEFTTPSPELLSLQGTYESLQESIRSYVECQTKIQSLSKSDFCKITCIPNPSLCAKPLKKSKTYFNISDSIDDEGVSCVCRGKTTERESNSGSCNSNVKEEKPMETAILKSEVVWDFVDILVDEVELWAEICTPIVFLQPTVIDLRTPVSVGEPPVFREVKIINCSKFSLKCEWLTQCPNGDFAKNPQSVNENLTVSLIFNKETKKGNREEAKSPKASLPTSENRNPSSDQTEDVGVNQPLGNSVEEKCAFAKPVDACRIVTEPAGIFFVNAMSEFTCRIGVSVFKYGKFSEILNLSVHESLEIPLQVQGKAVQKYFKASPHILDFGLLKQGIRVAERYKLQNEYPESLCVSINRYDFDFNEEKFYTHSQEDCRAEKQLLLNKGSTTYRYHYMDCRKPGISCSLLEIVPMRPKIEDISRQYVMVLGDVKLPDLSLSCPRFRNAILAPAGTLYVGKEVFCQITLKNIGKVETSFTWGSSFGCHSTKISVLIFPDSEEIKSKEQMQLNVILTPLDEGIISHCYVPCYFCRGSEPLILSIVAVVEKINVTFEIIDYPKQSHADVSSFSKTPFYNTVLRVSWPMKNFDPNLGLKYINESDILNMNCYCSDVEKEMARACGDQKNVQAETEGLEQARSSETGDKDTTERSTKSRDLRVSFGYASESSNESSLNDISSADKRKSETNSIQKYDSKVSFAHSVQFIKSELEFFDVPFQSPVKRQFVIRNETPIEAGFCVKAMHFGKFYMGKEKERKIEKIRDAILGSSKDNTAKYELGSQPVLITVEPSQGKLGAFEAVLIDVTVIGNTWGEYRDFLLCHIQGIEVFHLKVFIQIVGHPLYFPMFQNQDQIKPVLRFQPVGFASMPITKKIRVVNRSAIPLNVLWIIFLIQPLPPEEKETYNLCADSNANLDSNHSEESSKSVKIYLPKNMSKTSVTFKNLLEIGESSQNSKVFESVGKFDSFSDKNDMPFYGEGDRVLPSYSGSLQEEETKSDSVQIPYKIDLHNFLVEPKEMAFEPFEEKKMTITFNPSNTKVTKNSPVEFKAVLTACVKLSGEFEKSFGIYNRLCGMNFVSEVLNLDAIVEISPVTFEIIKGDLKFHVNANDVLKSPLRQISIYRKFTIKNNSQKVISLTIEIAPGVIFHVEAVHTLSKIYVNYSPKDHIITLSPGEFFEMELECSVTYKDVIYAYEQIKLRRKKNLNTSYSDHLKISRLSKSMNDAVPGTEKEKRSREPWSRYFNTCSVSHKTTKTSEKCILDAKDSIHLNLLRMSSKSDSIPCDLSARENLYLETEGEYVPDNLVLEEDVSCKPNIFQNMVVLEEEISFLHTDLIAQTLSAELYLQFPAIRLSQKALDFGNVYLNETGIRYCSLVNLKGFPIDFTIKSSCKVCEFAVSPSSGTLPPTNYKSDVGVSVTVEFTPTTPGYFADTLRVYCNQEMEFDYYEIEVAGIGTWNEKYRRPKMETQIQLPGIRRSNSKN